MRKGIAASPGVARGIAYVLSGEPWLFPRRSIRDGEVRQELDKLAVAISEAEKDLRSLRASIKERVGESAASVLDSQVLALRDPTFLREVAELVEQRKTNVEWAVAEVIDRYAQTLDRVGDQYFRERAVDIRDVGRRVMAFLAQQLSPDETGAPDGTVLVVRELLPTLAARLDRAKVKAIVAERGGSTSHAAIVARSLEIPAVVGVEGATHEIRDGDIVVVDGSAGLVFVNPGEAVAREYAQLEADLAAVSAHLALILDEPACTLDGVEIELLANIGKSADVDAAVRVKADGVGLFRTEFAYAIRAACPTEDEQVQIIERVAERFNPRTVVVRLLDVGSDKPLPYVPQAPEPNPALGERGIRLLLGEGALLATQLRAILRVASRFSLAILLPMVAGVEEVIECRARIAVARRSLAAEGLPFQVPPLGVMIEVPSVAILVGRLVPHVDFFSLGTNDLVQFLLAADREGPGTASYYQPAHPAVLATIRHVAVAARGGNKKLSICGEIAGDPRYTKLLLGLGLRSFSVSPAAILPIKNAIRQIRIDRAEQLAHEALERSTTAEIEELIASMERAQSR